MFKQKLNSDISWEVLLIDNNSNDNTAEVGTDIWKNFHSEINLTVISEPMPGLSYARKKAVSSAKGELLLFCDDDNWLDENYLQIAFDFMKNNPNVGVLGGKGIAVSSIEFPDWFTTYQGGYAVGVQNIGSDKINNRGYVWGSGMVVRTGEILSLYNSGFISLLTGRKGVNLSAGDDSEICKWFLLVEKDLFFNEQLIFKHYIEPFRLTVEYYKNMNNGFTLSQRALNQYDFILFLLNKKRKASFFKIISLFVIFLFERNRLKIKILLEFINKTPLTFHRQTKNILQSRKLFIENESEA
ncbi:glycosyltransferase protein [Flavobacterium frigoris PS1]|uniref:Glycosyltransferase protein n=1 Tax=Flavobacterium frigoris (strain PS1) TaxID=1086011 RepID=H7FM85_FLAFP|nr:glycosyltransferase protein [Flavobacterium frigoris PS1]